MAMALERAEASDGELIGLAREGDRLAFDALVERHYDFVYRVAWRWCGSRADAEDVAQEVCARLGKAIRGFRGGGAFTTWLYAMTLNGARDMAETLWAAVRRLPDKQRDAVLLVYGEELSHADAAAVMACAEATVSWHIHEAKKRLKVLLRPAGED